MSDEHNLRAFRYTLLAICYLVTVAAVLSALGRNLEAIGVSAAITGLIGVIRMPSARQVEVTNAPGNPVPVEKVP